MEIITYIKWTEPGEKDKFENLAKHSKNDEDLKQMIMQEMNLDSLTALRVINRFREKINILRTNK